MITAWHFFRADGLGYDRRGTVPAAGLILTHDGPVIPCDAGLHASVHAIDALWYAPGAWVERVELDGEIIPHGVSLLDPAQPDKHVASVRRTLWSADATRVLHELACVWATRALERERAAGREPDPRSWAAIEAKRAWLAGKISNEQLTAARAAAYAAAWDAAARDAAWDAAYAARDAAWDAAYAARAAAWDAAARDAAWSAADATASAAARDAAARAAAYAEIGLDLEAALLALAPVATEEARS